VITNLLVERVSGEVRVRWRGGDDPTVFFSGSPDDAGTVIVPVTVPGGVRVAGLPEGFRVYVHVLDLDGQFVVGGERLVPLAGTRNFRDIGGYVGHDGRQVRWGRVFRSDALHEVSGADLEVLDRLGVGVVVDLRGEAEALEAPNRFPGDLAAPVEEVRLPMGEGGQGVQRWIDRMASGSIDEITVDDVVEIYLAHLESYALFFGSVVRRAAAAGDLPLLVHCTAGKDRTGLAAALILAALGVADGDILDDYELTNRYRSAARVGELRGELAAAGVDIDRMLPYFTARRGVLSGSLAQLRERHGSVEGYLTGPGGLDPATLEALRTALLAP
jgi:protein-tyrosine phosphatase